MRADIITWNPINTNSSVLYASVYIKPTLKILHFFNKCPLKKAVVKIKKTGSCYDNQNMFATIEKSSDIPNTRDNFFRSTGIYIIVLHTLWYGFPLKKGYVEFQEGIVNDIIDYVSGCSDPPSDKLNTTAQNSTLSLSKLDKGNSDTNSSDTNSSDKGNSDTNSSDSNNQDNSNDNKKKSNKKRGLDNNVLLISALSIVLILILSFNN
jgi:hypothetical protein